MANFDRRLAEAVRVAIAAANTAEELPEAVTVERKYRPKREAKDLETPVVTVAHGLRAREPASRAHDTRTHTVRVGIQARVAQVDGDVPDARCDELSDLTEALMDLIGNQLNAFESATLDGISTDPFYDPMMLENPGIWQGILTLTYTRSARR